MPINLSNHPVDPLQFESLVTSLKSKPTQSEGVLKSDISDFSSQLDSLDTTGLDPSKVNQIKTELSSLVTFDSQGKLISSDVPDKWQNLMNETLDMLNSSPLLLAKGGYGQAMKSLSGENLKKANLPDAIAKLQSFDNPTGPQQVNQFKDGKGDTYYLSSGNGTEAKNYTLYDSQGKSMGTMTAPAALGLNDGKNFLQLSADGVSLTKAVDDVAKLPQGSQIFDINGATQNGGKIVARGTGGEAPSSAVGALTFRVDDGRVGAQKEAVAQPDGSVLQHSWVAVNSGVGGVTADVYSQQSPPGPDKYVDMFNENGEEMDLGDLAKGQPGQLDFTNGTKYVSNATGQWMVAGDKATNIETGETSTAQKVTDDLKDLGTRKPILMLAQSRAEPTRAVSPQIANDPAETLNFETGDGGKVGAQQQSTLFNGKKHLHSWVGISGDGGTTYADLYSGTQGNENGHNVRLKTVDGENINMPGLETGQYGQLSLTSGGKYVSNADGFWMIAGDKATNIATGKTSTAKEVQDNLAALNEKGQSTLYMKQSRANPTQSETSAPPRKQ